MTRGVQGLLTVIVCLLIIAVAVGFSVGKSVDTASQSATMLNQHVAADQPAAHQYVGVTSVQRTGLTIQEVMSWCRGTGCTADHFQQLPETGGVINPNGVLFTITVADQASDFTMPPGITADVWYCYPPSTREEGPKVLTRVCQASFRKG